MVSPGNLVPGALAALGLAFVARAVWCERRMQRHRLPGVGYWAATLRRDGGWRRADLFDAEGLRLQRRASGAALRGVALWALAGAVWVAFRL